ncbi:hypothetical protein XENOCAPTIV_011596 [Xenoophorus captivus]|uniref:Protein Wnt n=1 Tax=Xenoophorus captivus TaxID=1517983 RepID=A0ABV0S9G1_9TELE
MLTLHLHYLCACRYIGALGARVICNNIPGLVNKQRQLCQRHPDLMQSISEGAKEWIKECQHQFRYHRWNCSTLDRDHTVRTGDYLRRKYNTAIEVTMNQDKTGFMVADKDFQGTTKNELVYVENSPDYCVRDRVAGK